MKVRVGESGEIILEEVFSSLTLKTETEEFSICMRDSGFEFRYRDRWYEAKDGRVHHLADRYKDPVDEKAIMPDLKPEFEDIFQMVNTELSRARSLHPNYGFSTSDFLVALGEEYGESCQAHLNGEKDELRKELIQSIVVAVRILQESI